MPDSKAMEAANTAEKQNISTRGLDRIIGGIIFLAFFLCPLFFTGQAVQGIGFEKLVLFYFLTLLGVVAWVTKGVIAGELNLKRTPLDWPIVALVGIFTASALLSVNTKDSLVGAYGGSAKGLAAVVIFALFYYLVVNNLTAKRIKTIFWALAGGAGLIAAFSLLQLFEIHLLPMDFARQINFNPIGTLSGLTMYLVMALPLLVVAAAQTREIHPKISPVLAVAAKVFAGLAAAAAFTGLAILTGFTFWPAAIVSAVVVLMFFLSKIIKITSNNLVIPIASFLLLIILLVLGNFNIVGANLPSEVSLSRGASWDIAKSSMKEDPLLGSGPATYYYSFAKYKNPQFNNTPLWNIRFDAASGLFHELLATTGALGVAALAIVVLIVLSIAFLALIKIKEREVHSLLLAFFASFISALILVSLFTMNSSALLVVMLISVITAAAGINLYPERFNNLKLSFRASPKYALALAAIFLCVSAGVVVLFTMGLKLYLADFYARRSLAAASPEARIAELERAVQLTPYQDAYYLNLANQYMSVANQEAAAGGDQTKIQATLAQAIERGRQGVELSPNRAANNEALALIYENASFYTRGALEWSETYYQRVIELDPTNPTPYVRIALVNMARSNMETDEDEKNYYINEAIKNYDLAIAKKPDLAAAYYGKAIAYERLNNIDEAIEDLKRANLVARNNIDYLFELGRLYFNRGVTDPSIAQAASRQITESEIGPAPEGEAGEAPEFSVERTEPTGAVSSRNEDLNIAEQIFTSIAAANPNHANAIYSLAVLYQKIGDTAKARTRVQTLFEIITDPATRTALEQQFVGLY